MKICSENFGYGEEIEVSYDGVLWGKVIFISYEPNLKLPYIATSDILDRDEVYLANYKYARKYEYARKVKKEEPKESYPNSGTQKMWSEDEINKLIQERLR